MGGLTGGMGACAGTDVTIQVKASKVLSLGRPHFTRRASLLTLNSDSSHTNHRIRRVRSDSRM